MRLNKLKFISIISVCMIGFTLITKYFEGRDLSSSQVYFMVVMSMFTTALELIRIELGELRQAIEKGQLKDPVNEVAGVVANSSFNPAPGTGK